MTENIMEINGRTPLIASDAWVATTATVVGSASIGRGTGIYYSAVVRADVENTAIGVNSNIQDAGVIHADPGHPALTATTSVSATGPSSTAALCRTEPSSV